MIFNTNKCGVPHNNVRISTQTQAEVVEEDSIVETIIKQFDEFLEEAQTRDIVTIMKPWAKASNILHACCMLADLRKHELRNTLLNTSSNQLTTPHSHYDSNTLSKE